FTLATSAACSRMPRFLWMMPMPPSCAMAIARRASVTVSMAAETSGMFSSSLRLRRVFREASRGRMREWAGRRRTSSKVSAFWITRMRSAYLAKQHYTREGRASQMRYCHPSRRSNVEDWMRKLLLLAVLLAFSAGAAAQTYKWVDKDGKVRYGDTPPPDAKVQRLKPPPGPAEAPAA